MTQEPKAFVPSVGDECYLKSGSQRMTVEVVHPDTAKVEVVWMKYEEHEIRRDVLPFAVLDFKVRGRS